MARPALRSCVAAETRIALAAAGKQRTQRLSEPACAALVPSATALCQTAVGAAAATLLAQRPNERALALAAQSDRPADGKGVALTPLQRTLSADGVHYSTLKVEIDHAKRTATWTIHAPQGAQPSTIADIEAQGAQWFPLRMARELEDAILHMRTNELDIGIWLIKTEGDAAAVLAMDEVLQAHAGHWLVRETTGLLRRTLSRCTGALDALLHSGRSLRTCSSALLSPALTSAAHCPMPLSALNRWLWIRVTMRDASALRWHCCASTAPASTEAS